MRLNFHGDVHFVTFTTWNDQLFLADEKCCRLFLVNLEKLRNELNFKVFGFCIMPDHVHLLLQPRVSPNSFGEQGNAPNKFGVTQEGEKVANRVSPNSFGEQSNTPNKFGVTQAGEKVANRVSPNSFGEQGNAPNKFGVTQAGEKVANRVSPNSFGVTRKEDISYIIKRLKGVTARDINRYLNRQGSFWKHRFYDFNIYTRPKFQEKLNYIHKNPLKHQLVDDISQYPYCSWRNYELADNSIFSLDYPQY